MSHKWVIKRVKEDPLYFSENVGMQAKAAWEAGTPIIHLPGNVSVSNSSITAIEETYQSDDTYKEIGSGLPTKVEPILDTENNVVTNWYKMEINPQQWEKQFASQPHYYKLHLDNKTYAAVRLPEHSGEYDRGKEWMVCDASEAAMLYRIKRSTDG